MFIMVSTAHGGGHDIRAVYDKHRKKMLYTASRILGEQNAEDAVHDVFVNMILKYQGSLGELCDKPGRFFVVAVRNHSLNLLRKQKDISCDDELSGEDIFSAESPEDALISGESVNLLIMLIRRLKPLYREILEYKYILDYSNKEIAELLDVSQSVVSTRINRAKEVLKKMIETEEEAE